MIKIKKTPNADSRSAIGSPSKEELLRSTYQHIEDVQQAMAWMGGQLVKSAFSHDHTKISGIDDFYESFSSGLSEQEFKAGKFFQNHITERHHLKDRCPDDVNLFDVLERIADIVTAGMARSGTIYEESLDPDILVRAYTNTIKLLQANIVVVDDIRSNA